MKKIINLITSFSLFIMINLPSIKILWSSPTLNALSLLVFIIFGTLNFKFNNSTISKNGGLFLILFLFLWIILIIKTIIFSHLVLWDFLQYISVILMTTSVFLLAKRKNITEILSIQKIWGILLTALYFMKFIDVNRDLGQTYLTVAFPIGASFVIYIIDFIYNSFTKKEKVFNLIGIFFVFYGLLNLQARGSLIFSIVSPLIFVLVNSIKNKKSNNKVFLYMALVVIISIIFIRNTISLDLLNRLEMLFNNVSEEPRIDVYKKTLNLIIENPLGIGLNSFEKHGFLYPHNIILEVWLSGGLVALVIFLTNIIYIGVINYKNKNKLFFALITFSLYAFLSWNTSHSLTDSYIVFILFALTLVCQKREVYNYDNNYMKGNIKYEISNNMQ